MINQKNKEIIAIQKQTDADYLRRYLKQCEDEIMRLAYNENDKEMFNISNEDRILAQVEIRWALLNRLFELHCSEANLKDLEATNNRLLQREAKILEIHKQRFQQLTAIHPDYKLSTSLTYCHDTQNPQLVIREDDGFYGSQWNEMIEILDLIHGAEMTDSLYGCYDNFFDSYHNGLPLKETCNIDIVLPRHIPFCYSFCELCNHQYYSIPDIMRMTTYHIRQEVILDEALEM
jgi:hypothetical protein